MPIFPGIAHSSQGFLTLAQVETELAEVKSQAKMIFRRLNRNSEQQASIESGQYTLQ